MIDRLQSLKLLSLNPTSFCLLQLDVTAELYQVSRRHLQFNVTDILAFIFDFPNSMTSPKIVIPATETGAVFYNVTLQGLTVPLQAYTAWLTCLDCASATSGNPPTILLLTSNNYCTCTTKDICISCCCLWCV